MGAGAWSIVLQTLLQGASGPAILWHYSRWRPGLEFDRTAFRTVLTFGVSMVGIDILTVIQQQADNLLVGTTLGVAALASTRWRSASTSSSWTRCRRCRVWHCDLLAGPAGSRDHSRRAYVSASRLTTVATLPLFVGLALVAPEMISLLVGDKWSAAAPVLRALCPSGLILCLGYLDRSLIIALGRPRLALGLTTVGVALRRRRVRGRRAVRRSGGGGRTKRHVYHLLAHPPADRQSAYGRLHPQVCPRSSRHRRLPRPHGAGGAPRALAPQGVVPAGVLLSVEVIVGGLT